MKTKTRAKTKTRRMSEEVGGIVQTQNQEERRLNELFKYIIECWCDTDIYLFIHCLIIIPNR